MCILTLRGSASLGWCVWGRDSRSLSGSRTQWALIYAHTHSVYTHTGFLTHTVQIIHSAARDRKREMFQKRRIIKSNLITFHIWYWMSVCIRLTAVPCLALRVCGWIQRGSQESLYWGDQLLLLLSVQNGYHPYTHSEYNNTNRFRSNKGTFDLFFYYYGLFLANNCLEIDCIILHIWHE